MATRRRFLTLAAAGIAAPAAVRIARAETYPTRFVRLVVPFPPGGAVDNAARIIAARLSEMWGQQMVIENKGGAGGNIAAQSVLTADPDGYTVYICSIGHAINQFIYRSLGYDPVADFSPVTLMCVYPNILAVPNSSPDHDVPGFIARAKAAPGKMTYASSGIGTSLHLAGELFKRMAGVDLTHIPYRGAGPALNDLLPGRVDAIFSNFPSTLPYVQNGQLRGLAVTTAARQPEVPQPAGDRRIRARLRRIIVVRAVRCGEDAVRHRDEAASGFGRGAASSAGEAALRAARRHRGRVHAGRARRAPEGRNGTLGTGDQGGGNQGGRVVNDDSRILVLCSSPARPAASGRRSPAR